MKRKGFYNSCRIISALLALLMLLSFCGCDGDSTDVSSNPTPSDTVSSDDTSSDNTSSDNSSSEDTVSIDPLSGEFKVTGTLTAARSDAGEIKPAQHGPNVSNPLTGYANAEATALRNKILGTKNTEKIYKITGTKYYISPSGDDTNDGTSPKTAFRTIDGLNNITLKAGDAVLFERGATFRFKRSIVVVSGVTYGAYGEGDKPEIYASPQNFAAPNVWTPSKKKNVWQASFAYEPAGGLFFNHGEISGIQDIGMFALDENGYWYHDDEMGIVYLYCDKGNPSNVYKSIEITPSFNIITISRYVKDVTIDNLCLKYGGGFGISCAGDNTGITVTNCEIGYIGGLSNGTVRYGNSIEFWQGASDIIVENNWIYQTFDSAVTWQGHGDSEYDNISFSNNLFEYNNADIEFFERAGSTVSNFRMENNIMRFTSLGWGTRGEDGGIRGIEGIIRARTILLEDVKTISFKNNIIDCPGREIVQWTLVPEQKSAISASGNKVYIKASYRTTTEVIQGLLDNTTDRDVLYASNLAEFKAAYARFSTTDKIYWYN